METGLRLALPTSETETILSVINRLLAANGLSITPEDACMLAERRAEALVGTDRVEFGTPAIVEVAESVAGLPCITQASAVEVLAELQDAFYAIRDELSVDVPDAEIADALRSCLDAWEDTAEITSMPAEEIMRFSTEYMRVAEAEDSAEYRIIDDEGRVYTSDPAEWDYDEHADGWDGEGWGDDWGDQRLCLHHRQKTQSQLQRPGRIG